MYGASSKEEIAVHCGVGIVRRKSVTPVAPPVLQSAALSTTALSPSPGFAQTSDGSFAGSGLPWPLWLSICACLLGIAWALGTGRARRLRPENSTSPTATDKPEQTLAWLAQAADAANLRYYILDATGKKVAGSDSTGPEWPISDSDRPRLQAAHRKALTGSPVDVTYRVESASGLRTLREVARPVTLPDGQIDHVVCAVVDVSDVMPVGSGSPDLRHALLGHLSGGVAHDLNNILTVVLGNLELIEAVEDDAERRAMIGDAVAAALRGREINRSILSYARGGAGSDEELDLNSVVLAMLPLLRRTMPESIALETVLDPELPLVVAPRSLADSAVLNLALNARDAMPGGGRLIIESRWEKPFVEGQQGYTVLTVRDNGVGIDANIRDRLFEPFISTKGGSQNAGLGLAMVQSFADQAGGTVKVETSPGNGSAFHVYLRATQNTKKLGSNIEKAVHRKPAQSSARILVVEDNPGVRNVLVRQLQRVGHDVTAVSSADEGAEMAEMAPPFDLLLSDLVVPGDLQGPELADRLTAKQPNLRVLFLTGYAEGMSRLRHRVLRKPLNQKDLFRAVDDTLAV